MQEDSVAKQEALRKGDKLLDSPCSQLPFSPIPSPSSPVSYPPSQLPLPTAPLLHTPPLIAPSLHNPKSIFHRTYNIALLNSLYGV